MLLYPTTAFVLTFTGALFTQLRRRIHLEQSRKDSLLFRSIADISIMIMMMKMMMMMAVMIMMIDYDDD